MYLSGEKQVKRRLFCHICSVFSAVIKSATTTTFLNSFYINKLFYSELCEYVGDLWNICKKLTNHHVGIALITK